jgi:hypothetical protein
LIIRSVAKAFSNGFIQQVAEGFYASVETSKNKYEEDFQDWDAAKSWVESKMYEIEVSEIVKNS